MANASVQMNAGSQDVNVSPNGQQQQSVTDRPAAVRRGLDTGARGWRWLVSGTGVCPMHGADPGR